MKWIALILSFLMCFTISNAQSIDSLKHIVVVTELQDSMALINNEDINIINKVFYERNILDSLNTINDTLIKKLEIQRLDLQKIILNQKVVIQNDSLIKLKYQSLLDDQNKILQKYQKDIKKQKTQKTIWMSTSGGLAIALFIVLLI